MKSVPGYTFYVDFVSIINTWFMVVHGPLK